MTDMRKLFRDYAKDAYLEEPDNDDITMFHLLVDIFEYGKFEGIDVRENMKEAFIHVFPTTTPAK